MRVANGVLPWTRVKRVGTVVRNYRIPRKGARTLPLERRLTINEQVYLQIKAMIARRELPPGTPLVLRPLASKLGVSKMPVIEAIRRWYRKLIANKFDGSKASRSRGRPKMDEETENLVVRMAQENPSWSYDRIVGALANLGHELSDQTVGRVQGSVPYQERLGGMLKYYLSNVTTSWTLVEIPKGTKPTERAIRS